MATNLVLVCGARMPFHAAFDAGRILADMPRATVLMGVPTFYTRLLEQPGLAEATTGLRLFISASAPLLAETHHRRRAVTGHSILERGGMTETNMSTSNPFDGDRHADGSFVTSDLGMINDDGYVTLVGRAKDLIITGGLNVYPKEVEEVIDDIDGVTESAVIGVPHPDLGEAVVAIVVGKATAGDILHALTGKLARFMQP